MILACNGCSTPSSRLEKCMKPEKFPFVIVANVQDLGFCSSKSVNPSEASY